MKHAASVPTHMLPISELYLASEAPKGADLQVRDSTRGSPLTDDELRASIYNNGIIVPLMWKEHAGKRYVVAGNRRLRMLREIFADALSTPVKTENVDDYPGDWRDIAMDTNLALPPHLVERYEMIVRIAKDEKLPPAEVCKRYGMSESQYRRVMALGKMAPVVRQAWKDSKIDAKTAEAFTLQSDPKEQEKLFDRLWKNSLRYAHSEEDAGIDHWEVRNSIIPQSQQKVGQLVAFVGVDVVREAKLFKQEDLFGKSHTVTDTKALNKMVSDKMAEQVKKLLDEGWSWAVPADKLQGQEYQYGTQNPDKDGNYTDAQKKRAGCILKIGHNGELEIVYGKVKPAEKQAAAAAERRAAPSPSKPEKKAKPGEVLMTHALADRMSANFEKAVSAAMVSSPYVCVAAMIAGFASFGELITVTVGNADRDAKYDPKFDEEKTFLQVFEGALKASPQEQAVMLAGVAAKALEIHAFNAEAALFKKEGLPTLHALVKALPKNVVDKALMEAFDAADYFGNVSQQAIVDAVSCSMGPDFARDVAKMKKKDAAAFAAEHVKGQNYLPPFMRTPHYTGPIEKPVGARPPPAPKKASAKKARKAAKKQRPGKK